MERANTVLRSRDGHYSTPYIDRIHRWQVAANLLLGHIWALQACVMITIATRCCQMEDGNGVVIPVAASRPPVSHWSAAGSSAASVSVFATFDPLCVVKTPELS